MTFAANSFNTFSFYYFFMLEKSNSDSCCK